MLRGFLIAIVVALLCLTVASTLREGTLSAANGVALTNVSAPDANGISNLQFTVNIQSSDAVLSVQGTAGHFTSAAAVAGICLATPTDFSSNTVVQVSYSSSCLAGLTPPGPVAGSAQWRCDSAGLLTFRLQQGGNIDTRQISCNSATTTTNNPIFVTATPNVVPCGGRTLITANVRDVSGNIVPNTVFHFDTDQGLLDPSGINTAVLTVYPGMSSARVRASAAGFVTSDILLVQVFCPTPTSLGSNSLGNNSLGTPIAAQPAAATSLTLTANPGAVERCGGTVFVVASIKDASGRPAADGTTVLFIASGGTISTDSATTVAGTATITFTADRTMTGSVKISGQAGAAFASVNIPIACTASEAIRAGAGTPVRPSSSTTSMEPLPTNGNDSSIPPPLSSVPRSGNPGELSGIIRPPSTGDAGLASCW